VNACRSAYDLAHTLPLPLTTTLASSTPRHCDERTQCQRRSLSRRPNPSRVRVRVWVRTCVGARERVRVSVRVRTHDNVIHSSGTRRRDSDVSERDNVRKFYTGRRKLRRSIRIRHGQKRRLPPDEALDYLHLTVCFSHLVFSACRWHNVTPQTATGSEFDLTALMTEAESMLGVATSKASEAERERRRRYAYSQFLRLTSAGVRL